MLKRAVSEASLAIKIENRDVRKCEHHITPDWKTYIGCQRGWRHNGGPIDGPSNPSIPQCCDVKGYESTPNTRLQDSCTPDRCSFSSLTPNVAKILQESLQHRLKQSVTKIRRILQSISSIISHVTIYTRPTNENCQRGKTATTGRSCPRAWPPVSRHYRGIN